VLYPSTSRVYVDTSDGSSASENLTYIAPGTMNVGAIIIISPSSDARTIVVYSGYGNIVLKSAYLDMSSVWARLWLQWDGNHWSELARDYGQNWQHELSQLGIDGGWPQAGYPATYSHATGAQAAAGTAENATMTPAATAVALSTVGLVTGNKTYAGVTVGTDYLLTQRDGALVLTSLAAPGGGGGVFTKYAVTGELGVSAGANGFAAHGMGGMPTLVRGYYRCKAADADYSIGMELPVECCSTFAGIPGYQVSDPNGPTPISIPAIAGVRRVAFGADGGNYYYNMSGDAAGIQTVRRGAGDTVTLTNASWRFFIRMWL
jgi:hypothetical protein